MYADDACEEGTRQNEKKRQSHHALGGPILNTPGASQQIHEARTYSVDQEENPPYSREQHIES